MATMTPYKRELPFIHRAWKTAVDHLSPYSMGIKLSSTNGDTVVNDDHALRAAKRRRITEDSSESTPKGILGHMLSERDNDFEKALRVDVLQITHKDSPNHRSSNLLNGTGSPVKKEMPAIRVRCKLTIFRWRFPIKEIRVLYCDSQICNLKVFRDADGACRRARIYLTSPFHVPAEKLCVERDDENGFDLADQYLVQAELESAGDPSWPPVDLLPKDEANDPESSRPQLWVLTSSVVYKFEKHRASAPVKIRKRVGSETALDLSMDMDLRWSACHSAGSVTEVEVSPPEVPTSFTSGALEPLTNGHVNGRSDNTANGPTKDEDVFIEEDEDHEEAATPSRSLRTREKQNYNLKLLSDKARGKERKERKQRKLTDARVQEAGQTTWVLPRSGKVVLKGYQCIRCFGVHSSMNQLIEHVKVHPEFKYDFDPSSSRIWVFQHGQEIRRRSSSSLLKVASSEDPESELEDYVSPHKIQKSLAQSKSLPSNTPKDPRQLVPNNKQPMYDRLSKAILEPGTFVDPPDIDDTWLVQKHRDIIRDYSDVHPAEKEFISEWDAYVNKECVTSDPHLQDVYLKFVQLKASWLVASQSRMTEFSKHLAYLKARDALTESTIAKVMAIMRQARDEKRPEQPEITKPPSPRTQYRKSASGCAVCGQPIRGPSTLICSNMDCEKPLYHADCIRKAAKMPVEKHNWCCNSCCDS
ncbi:uncharacterized protein GGS22DRAFT_163581 [Annulohypoxylon maeteangense]|uniref:uncharacterized protein n=1 Tax=Annulohypoxylon maeteangense TaxID=1927788 RepID=UPI00200728B1|nr:uncharacterized protein GGS22DRAFT_163581 [Annulohypoxylon maeteangense]KAI0885383.1 hypothetical protein GGS22DRAFT_163581 [Annulohypoxylon maeteangense]